MRSLYRIDFGGNRMDHKVANIVGITSFVIMLMRKKAAQFPGERGGEEGEGGTVRVELACSPYVCVGFLQEFQFLLTCPKCAG